MKKNASAGNRTRGSRMASGNFTTKPLMLTNAAFGLLNSEHNQGFYIFRVISSILSFTRSILDSELSNTQEGLVGWIPVPLT